MKNTKKRVPSQNPLTVKTPDLPQNFSSMESYGQEPVITSHAAFNSISSIGGNSEQEITLEKPVNQKQ